MEPLWKNGCALASARRVQPCLTERITKNTITSIWNAISRKLAVSATRMPSTLNIVVSTMKAINQIQLGTDGNSADM